MTPEARAAHRKRMRRLRRRRARRKLCLRCNDPPAIDPDTGLLRRHCQRHLDDDASRKRKERPVRSTPTGRVGP